MAKIHTLTYNGTKSSDLGVFVSGSGSFDAAEFDVDKYEIPGRNGDLILSNNRYKNIEITYPAFIPKAFMDKVQNVRNWLRSSKVYARLEDTYDMDHYRLGIPTGVQSFSSENRNDGANFEMTFDCKPQRFLKVGETPETVEADVQTETGEIVTFETVAESPINSASVSLSPIQSGSGDPSPTNIRPISGHTGAELIRTGKNLVGAGNIVYGEGYDGNGNTEVNANRFRTEKIACYGKTAIALSWTNGTASSQAIRVIWDKYGNVLNRTIPSATSVGTRKYYVTNLTNFNAAYYVAFAFYSDGGAPAANNVSEIMCEFVDSPSEYEPYQGDTYSVTFTDQGTVYGGTFDFVSGKLTVTHRGIDLSTLSGWSKYANIDGTVQVNITVLGMTVPGYDDVPSSDSLICSHLQNATRRVVETKTDTGIGIGNASIICIYAGEHSATVSDWTMYLAAQTAAGTPVMIVAKLATPLEYTLTPQQLTTLQGQNVVWGSGPITLTYAEPYNVDNPTLFDARPLFKVTNPAEGDVIMVNGQAISFVDGYTGTVYIDCETMNAFSGAANLNSIIQATDFPVLVPGTNIVTWTGAGECTMTPRWWEL